MDKIGKIFLLVECKSYDQKLDQKVVDQVAQYNKVLDSCYLAITNGLKHYVWENMNDEFRQIKDFPVFRLNEDKI